MKPFTRLSRIVCLFIGHRWVGTDCYCHRCGIHIGLWDGIRIRVKHYFKP